MKSYTINYLNEEKFIVLVEAKTEQEALKKSPFPIERYRKVWVEESKNNTDEKF